MELTATTTIGPSPPISYHPTHLPSPSSSQTSLTEHSPGVECKASPLLTIAEHGTDERRLPIFPSHLSYSPASPFLSQSPTPLYDTAQTVDAALSPPESMSHEPWHAEGSLSGTASPGVVSLVSGVLSVHDGSFSVYNPGMPHTLESSECCSPPSLSSLTMRQSASSMMDGSASRPSLLGSLQYSNEANVALSPMHTPDNRFSALSYQTTASSLLLTGNVSSAAAAVKASDFRPSQHRDSPQEWQSAQSASTALVGIRHLESHVPGVPHPMRSILSNQTTPTRRVLDHKKRRQHTRKEEANFQCLVDGCGKFFSRSYNFKSHMETHDEKREYPFTCQETGCPKKFVRKTDLQRHHQSVHAKEKNHKCDYCARMFARKDTLRRHMEDGCSKRFDLKTIALQSNKLNFDAARAR